MPLDPTGWRVCVAPMMDWTDRHCRQLHRLITRHARLYTEMVTTGALLHGDVPRHLAFGTEERPLALQLGGSEPEDLAACARLAQQWGYDEINLNCGCPSERVQRGAFGACLMAEAQLVKDCVQAMRGACELPVTVKHRIGIDREDSYAFVREFVGTVSEGGCEVFIVHARSAWLKGLSPKQNREVPPLRYDYVARLREDFPQLHFVLNGGVSSDEAIAEHLQHCADGVMIGRHAYHEPYSMRHWDERFFGATHAIPGLDEVEERYVAYIEGSGTAWPQAVRHMLGLRNGQAGARRWRQVWSDHRMKQYPVREVWRVAQQALRDGTPRHEEETTA